MDKLTEEKRPSRYSILIENVFFKHYNPGIEEFEVAREELHLAADELGIERVKNLGDLLYSFRYRAKLPQSVVGVLPDGWSWLIWPAGASRYRFVAMNRDTAVVPNLAMSVIKIADSTPGVISKYSLSDEQALLAILGYCRMLDIFTGLSCYRLQSHLRTQIPGWGQVETDDLYIGIDRRGAHFVLPVQAKGKNDRLSIVQVAQDIALCNDKFPNLICRAISDQFMPDGGIALFSFEADAASSIPALIAERHYRLVPHDQLTSEDLKSYQLRHLESTI